MKKTILTILILSLLLSVCSCASSSSKEIESLNQKISELEKQAESTTAVSDTEASIQVETTIDESTTSPEIVTESIAITLEQETPFEVSGAMPIEEFAKLSYADRAAWAVSAGYSNIFDYLPEDINQIDWTDAPGRYWFKIQTEALAYEDPLDRQKIASIVDYYLCDNETGEMSEWFKENANYFLEEGGQGELPATILSYISSSEIKQDQVGSYVEITYDTTSYSTGEVTGKKQTVKAYAIVVKMLDGTSFNTCVRGALIEES